MECSQTTHLSGEDFLPRLREKLVLGRVPLSGSIELTHRCNLRCIHCYLGPQHGHETRRSSELSTEQVISLIDEITDAGCLFFLITGGEPLLREDFPEIYRHAKVKGLLVTVFTNGTLVGEDVLELFTDLPPQVVEVSLYGATAATYEKITGVRGSYERCLAGIRQLLGRRVNLKLKTVLMTLNRHEYYDMEKMAKAFGVKFRFDPAISPRFDGDMTPLALRVPPREAAEKEFSDSDRRGEWTKYLSTVQSHPVSDTLYNCTAGLTSFHINPYGGLQPCLMALNPKYDLLKGGFSDGWRNVMPRLHEIKVGEDYVCNRCSKRDVCGYCAPSFALEDAERIYSEYYCELSELRWQAIHNGCLMKEEG